MTNHLRQMAIFVAVLAWCGACSTNSKKNPSPDTRVLAGNEMQEPAPQGEKCGSKICGKGLVCCNASCGMCAPPDGVCTQQFCEEAPPTTAHCKVDGDCRIFSDYCTGCDCRALATGESDPTCTGPGVRCLMDPCQGKTAICLDGHCSTKAR